METLHPIFVHFPIAFVFAVLFAEVGRALFGRPCLETVRFLAWLTLIAIAAGYWSGHREFDSLGVLNDAAIETKIGEHENTARIALWCFPIAVLLLELSRLAAHLWWPAWGFRVLLVGTVFLISLAGLKGGELVYTHGVGTALYPRTSSSQSGSTQNEAVPKDNGVATQRSLGEAPKASDESARY